MCLSKSRRTIASLAIVFALSLSALAPRLCAQSPGVPFTVDDLLEVANVNIADLSNDGKWLAATSGTLRDRIGIDNRRFGDPTYIAPSAVDVWIIDTQTAKAQKLFSSKRQVRGMQWSPDATRLAFLAVKGDAFEPVIWERPAGRFVNLKLPAGQEVADNTELEWSPDGGQLLLTLRSDGWRKQTAERFKYETAAPVVVHSSKEPFLAWDDLRRLSAIRSLAAYDLKTGETRELLPETRLGSYNLTEDGSFLTFAEDITKKTNYDVIGGTENQIHLTTAAGAGKRTIIKSTKGISLQWSRDYRHYAYGKEGNIFIASIDDKEARQLTGKKSEPEKEKAESADKPKDDAPNADKDKKEKERFNVVRLSPKGDQLIVSNKEGLWLMDATTGVREMIVKTSDEDKESPRYQVVDWSPNGDNLS